ncbi:MAG: type II toxin-antitoxin system HicA family toxin [Firmicutes bacterium]|nr:type II toxin-antitoxin system HicA family toxin [Bacillota bacterium]MCL5063973.1 type II toxin-antitoxin system HicA family toxin [Bacillota bacterium]
MAHKLRVAGFEFDRAAKGSREIWRNALDGRRTTIPHQSCVARGDCSSHCAAGGVIRIRIY